MSIDDRVRLQEDAIASVRSTGIIGDKFVKITLGGRRVLSTNARSNTSTASGLATIEEPAVIVKILTHLGLPTRAPPRSPARIDEFLQTA